MIIDGLDHLVLTVRDLHQTCAFYHEVLGMTIATFGFDRYALVFGIQKINLHVVGHEFEPKAARPTPGSADLCFVTSVPLPAVLAHLQTLGIPVLEGPVVRTGARGRMHSVYLRDPDENLIEISTYVSDDAEDSVLPSST